MRYADAFALQQQFVERRKRGEIPDQLLIVEHPHVVTMGRNGHDENLLARRSCSTAPASSFIAPIAAAMSPITGRARSSAIPSSICENGSAT